MSENKDKIGRAFHVYGSAFSILGVSFMRGSDLCIYYPMAYICAGISIASLTSACAISIYRARKRESELARDLLEKTLESAVRNS